MKTQNKKTEKKKLVITWPTTPFTIEQLQGLYPTAKNITLRFRVNRSIDNNELVLIGKNSGSVGRPTLVFAKAPVSKETLAGAVKAKVILDEQYTKSVAAVTQFPSVPNPVQPVPTVPEQTAAPAVVSTPAPVVAKVVVKTIKDTVKSKSSKPKAKATA